MQISYEQAKAAHERGEKVEHRCGCGLAHAWQEFNNEVDVSDYEFRLADPYAELKAAHKAGKVIQFVDCFETWSDLHPPISWTFAPDRYRVRPDEDWRATSTDRSNFPLDTDSRVKPDPEPLKIEAGKDYCNKLGERVRVLSVDSKVAIGLPVIGEVDANIFRSRHIISRLFRADGSTSNPDYSLVSEWIDAPAPYDNWQHVPAWHRYEFMSPNGHWYSSEFEPMQKMRNWRGTDYHVALPLPKKYAPTNFTGTWETSLQERPKL